MANVTGGRIQSRKHDKFLSFPASWKWIDRLLRFEVALESFEMRDSYLALHYG